MVGSIQFQGRARCATRTLPANTLQVKGESVCASLRGLPIRALLQSERIERDSFRGSISGLGFAYCDFTRRPDARRA